jgi:hypothetical protein
MNLERRPINLKNGRRSNRNGLGVSRIGTRSAADEGVLADRGRRQELLGGGTAHGPRHRGDDRMFQFEPSKGPLVGSAHHGVRLLELTVGEREGIGVLHQEFAAAQQAGSGPGLVAELGLHLEEDEWEIAIGAGHLLHEQGEHLFVGGREQIVGAAAILQREDVIAVFGPAVADVVGLARQQRRERDLLTADRRHLLADDRRDPVEHQLAEREPGVTARRRATNEAGPEQQPMARHLRVGRLLAQGLEQQAGHPQQHAEHRSDAAGG